MNLKHPTVIIAFGSFLTLFTGGSVAVFSSWAQHYVLSNDQPTEKRVNPMTLGCIAGSLLLKKAASLAFEKNKRSTVTTDIIEYLGKSLEDICPAEH
uniref:Uncharacterized protein n=1 Tax=Arundo donax TaxID=35708 RepID=A0A0A9C279_ARUDO